jgi:hypothetical protein
MALPSNYVAPPDLGQAGSQSGGSLTQGAAMPNVSTVQTQATAAPAWYTDYLQNIAQQGTSAAQNAQFVGIQPMQQASYDLATANVGNYKPTLNAATGALDQSINATNPLSAANPYLTSAANPTYNTVQNYMNPYTQQVVSQIGDLAQQNIMNNVAPQTNAGIVGSGQFGSQRGAQALGQTLANYGQQTTAAQTNALNTGYQNAMKQAQDQAVLFGQLGSTAGQLASAGQQNLNQSAQIGGQLATTTQGLGLGDVNALNTLGTQQQQIRQAEQLFPLQMAQAQAGLLQGAQIPTSSTSMYAGPIPGAYQNSPLTNTLGTLSSLGGLFSSPTGGKSAIAGIKDTFGNLFGPSEAEKAGIAAGKIYGAGNVYGPGGSGIVDTSNYANPSAWDA